MNRIEELVRPNIRALCPYSTARDEYQGSVGVFLDANENPFPNGYNRYPDPRQRVLKERVSALKGVPVRQIFLGNGSDEAIDLVLRIFCTPGRDKALCISPSYGMYSVAADINDVALEPVLLGKDFSLPTEEILAAGTDAKLLFLCSPNNPSGNAFPRAQLEGLIARFPGIVVVDEAYADFSAKGSLVEVLDRYPNLVILQTFSKAYGLAGLRLGMAFASAYIIELMNRVKYPYNISQLTQDTALKALEQEPPVALLVREREALQALLPRYRFVKKLYPSDANFLLVQVADADALYQYLLEKGIIVRNRSRVPLCEGCLRITVGTPEENQELIAALDAYEKSNLY